VLRIAGVGLAAALVACAPAYGSVVTVPANKLQAWVQYDASPGEANRVAVTVGKDVTGSWQVTIADPGADTIQTPPSDDPAYRSCVPAGLHRVVCRSDFLDSVQLSLGDGNDTSAASGLPVFIGVAGGDGDDRLTGGPGQTSFMPGLGTDVVIGGPGPAAVFYDDHPAAVRVSLDGVANDGMPGEGDNVTGVHQLFGTRYDDALIGSDDADVIDGIVGHDLLAGRGGDDTLESVGGDRLVGGPGRDLFKAYNGGNTIYAVDGEQDTVDCGYPRDDVLKVDAIDVVRNCPG
jgi:Ca2+-binding RTX toxin-like protein